MLKLYTDITDHNDRERARRYRSDAKFWGHEGDRHRKTCQKDPKKRARMDSLEQDLRNREKESDTVAMSFLKAMEDMCLSGAGPNREWSSSVPLQAA